MTSKRRGRSTNKRMIQSVDFNARPNFRKGFSEQFQARDISPIALIQQQVHQGRNLQPEVVRGKMGIYDDQLGPSSDIIVTETDVSHLSSFYEVP